MSTSRDVANRARTSALGYFVPRSILLKKITEISAFSAKTAWVNPLLERKDFILPPKRAFMAFPFMPIPPRVIFFNNTARINIDNNL